MLVKRLAGASAAVLLAGCAFGLTAASASAAPTLNGQGSTLVAPLEQEWAAAFDSATGDTVNYTASGSGAGYKGVASGADDFGASDAPLAAYSSPACSTSDGPCIQIPWALSATGVSFHINGLRLPAGKALHLSGPVLAEIYLGQITNWSDHRITSLNKGAHIPSTPITVFWRNDASGDSFAFSSYLSDVNGTFKNKVGSSTLPTFPVGVGAKGNSGMATALAGANGGIAYISVAYLLQNKLPAAGIKNAHGTYAVPNLSAIESAARAHNGIPGNNQLTIVNPGRGTKNAYPISTYTYVMVPTNAPQGALLKAFIGYALSPGGQSFGPRLGFAPLPAAVHSRDESTLNSIN